jgi:hypothetical protein
MAGRPSPRWAPESEACYKEYVKKFTESLRRLTLRFAHHGRANTIDVFHVDEAFEALVRFGLRRQAWYKRSELKITIGAALVATAVSTPDFMPLLSDDVARQQAITIGSIIVFGFLGGMAYLWGWFQGKI